MFFSLQRCYTCNPITTEGSKLDIQNHSSFRKIKVVPYNNMIFEASFECNKCQNTYKSLVSGLLYHEYYFHKGNYYLLHEEYSECMSNYVFGFESIILWCLEVLLGMDIYNKIKKLYNNSSERILGGVVCLLNKKGINTDHLINQFDSNIRKKRNKLFHQAIFPKDLEKVKKFCEDIYIISKYLVEVISNDNSFKEWENNNISCFFEFNEKYKEEVKTSYTMQPIIIQPSNNILISKDFNKMLKKFHDEYTKCKQYLNVPGSNFIKSENKSEILVLESEIISLPEPKNKEWPRD